MYFYSSLHNLDDDGLLEAETCKRIPKMTNDRSVLWITLNVIVGSQWGNTKLQDIGPCHDPAPLDCT
jgi:hypothetical protein